jgi:Cu(I)/Ag(I) efflux system membrane protein CusA/SilA
MTVMAAGIGLVPLLWAHGAGADTMRRLAVPMIGGLMTSFALEQRAMLWKRSRHLSQVTRTAA